MSLTEQLQDAIKNSGVTLYRIAKDAGVPYSMVHRFTAGERQIGLNAADKLAAYFGMRLTAPKRVKTK